MAICVACIISVRIFLFLESRYGDVDSIPANMFFFLIKLKGSYSYIIHKQAKPDLLVGTKYFAGS